MHHPTRRDNLIGEHIDYCDGFVMPFAIDRYIVIAGCANGTTEARITSTIGKPNRLVLIDWQTGEPELVPFEKPGSTVTLRESSKASEIAATLAAEYEKATGITPQIFASRPSQGAHLVG